MSFIDGSIKPRLVEQKIVDKITKVQEENKPFKFDFDFNLVRATIFKGLSRNMIPLIIIFIVIILLLYRYYDVKKKKEKLINKDNSFNNYYSDSDNDNDNSDYLE